MPVHADLAGLDPDGGGIWVLSPPDLIRLAEDGTLLERIDRVRIDAESVEIPPLVRIHVTADAAAIWGRAEDGTIYRILLRDAAESPVRPPRMNVVVEPGDPLFSELSATEVFAPSALGASSTGFAWVALRGGTTRIAKLFSSGTVSPVFTIPENALDLIGASSSTASADLCFATRDGSGRVRMRRMSAAGVMSSAGTIALAGSIESAAMADDSTCWLGAYDTLYSFPPGGGVFSAGFDDKTVTSIAAISEGRSVVTVSTNVGDNFTPDVTFRYIMVNMQEGALLSPTNRMFLVDPSSATAPPPPF